ncbi:MAG: ABC transporter permease subunit [Anaerolineales bacterium]|nr:ABC transporter permease subunit [Anaerolineales bacterium]
MRPETGKFSRVRGSLEAFALRIGWGGKPWLMAVTLVPLVISFLLFWIYPIIASLIYSFTRWQAFEREHPFVGLENFARAFGDPIFIKSLSNTILFAIIYLPLIIIGGLVLALLVNAAGRLKETFRMIYFIPVVTSVIATAFVWRYMYQPRIGIFNMFLEALHLPPQRWLLDIGQALPSVVVYAAWQSLGLNMVWFLAGLTTIDQTYYDAALVDGASSWQLFRHITLPLLRPTFAFVSVVGAINAFQIFGPIYIMTATGISSGDSPPGGPANSTMVVVLYQWLTAFRELNLGYGAAMGIILLLIILGLTILQLRWLRTRWEY